MGDQTEKQQRRLQARQQFDSDPLVRLRRLGWDGSNRLRWLGGPVTHGHYIPETGRYFGGDPWPIQAAGLHFAIRCEVKGGNRFGLLVQAEGVEVFVDPWAADRHHFAIAGRCVVVETESLLGFELVGIPYVPNSADWRSYEYASILHVFVDGGEVFPWGAMPAVGGGFKPPAVRIG